MANESQPAPLSLVIEDVDRLLKPQEVAVLLGIGRTKAYEMIAAGELPVTRVGTSPRVQRRALLRWIADRTQSTN